MPLFKVWHPDDEAPEDGADIDANSPEAAAEVYASTFWTAGHSDSVDLMVSDEQGNEYDVTVDVEFPPQFFAYSRKVKK